MKVHSISDTAVTISSDQTAYHLTNDEGVVISNTGLVDVSVGGFTLKSGQSINFEANTSTIDSTFDITFDSTGSGTKRLDILKEVKTLL